MMKKITGFFSKLFPFQSTADARSEQAGGEQKQSAGGGGPSAGGTGAPAKRRQAARAGGTAGAQAGNRPQSRREKDKNKRGMTLIEILIVVGIITSVLGFVMNRVIKRGKKAKVSQAKIMLSALSQSVDEFSMDCGFYPETLKDLIEEPGGACEEWDGPYVKGDKFLKDPWKNKIHYEYDSARNEYELISFGADRRAGGSGLNQDISSEDL